MKYNQNKKNDDSITHSEHSNDSSSSLGSKKSWNNDLN